MTDEGVVAVGVGVNDVDGVAVGVAVGVRVGVEVRLGVSEPLQVLPISAQSPETIEAN